MNGMTLIRAISFSAYFLLSWCGSFAQAQTADSHKEQVTAVEPGAQALEADAMARGLTNQIEAWSKQAGKAAKSASHEIFWAVVAYGLVMALLAVRYLPKILAARDARTQARLAAAVAAAQVVPSMAAEERAFNDFATEFLTRPLAPPATPPMAADVPTQSQRAEAPAASEAAERSEKAAKTQDEKQDDEAVPAADPLKEFFAEAPKTIGIIRDALHDIGRAADEAAKQKLVARLAQQAGGLKTASEQPALLPAWQTASALEALLKQLSDKPQNITPSTLRTVAAAVDLISTLSARGIRPDLAQSPPIRVLAVDDDPISRHAVSFALKKALNLPDLAANGEAGLKLALESSYDAIFLDVQMPGMDGFELCSKIRQTELNKTTPIVFITCMSDFNARAKSTLAGGQDLIGKPFLTFEVTLKALTMILRSRVEKKGTPEAPKAPKAPKAEKAESEVEAVTA